MAKERRVVAFVLAVLLVSGSSCLVAKAGEGNLECEDLPIEDCAFSVSSSGARCVLERSAENELQCQTSFIMAERRMEWIETSECIKACGVDRMTLGMSTDSLTDMPFLTNLCSHQCNHNCHNIFDLYTSLTAGDGLYLPRICSSVAIRSQRMKVDLPYPTAVARLPAQQVQLSTFMPESDKALAPASSPVESLASSPDLVAAASPEAAAAAPQAGDDDYFNYYEQEPGYVEAAEAPSPSPSSSVQGVAPAESPDYYYHSEEEPSPSAEPPEPYDSHSYDEYYYPTALPPSSGEAEESVDGGNYYYYDHQDSEFDYMEPWY